MSIEGLTAGAMVISIILSLAMAIGLTYLYIEVRKAHITIWSIALYFMTLRVLRIYLENMSIFPVPVNLFHFVNDVFLITVDLLWIYGIFHFLEYSREKKNLVVYGFMGYLLLYTILSFINTPTSTIIGEITTLIIIHPILLSYLFWIFYTSGKEVESPTMRYLGIAFLIWALDFIIFGIPYFVFKNTVAGASGWAIGVIFRLMLIFAFIKMREEAINVSETRHQAG